MTDRFGNSKSNSKKYFNGDGIMKRILSLAVVMALCISLMASFAYAEEFVPSIGDKDHPEIVPVGGDVIGQIVSPDGSVISDVNTGCLVITPVSEAETSTDIPEEARDKLIDVYEQLSNGSMELPYDSSVNPDDMVIRDLFDLSFLCEEHPEMLNNGGTLKVTFDLGVSAGDTVVAMVYVNGQWTEVKLTNNGDGTVTCYFTDVCPVVFSVKQTETPPQTGDFGGNDILMWSLIMAGSFAALVICVVIYRKKASKQN